MKSIELVFLGTAGAIPTENRRLIATAVKREREIILVDAGEDVQRSFLATKLGMNKPLKILITHLHSDHINGLQGLLARFAMNDREEPVDIFGPPGIAKFIRCLLEVEGKTGYPYYLRVYEINKEGVVYENSEYQIIAFNTCHNIVPAFGYIVEEKPIPGKFYPERALELGIPRGPLWKALQQGKTIEYKGRKVKPSDVMGPPKKGVKIVFSGDTTYCERVIDVSKNADILIHEGMYGNDMAEYAKSRGHSTVADAARVALVAGVKKLFITHVSSRYKEEDILKLQEEAKAIFPEAVIAHDLMRVKVR